MGIIQKFWIGAGAFNSGPEVFNHIDKSKRGEFNLLKYIAVRLQPTVEDNQFQPGFSRMKSFIYSIALEENGAKAQYLLGISLRSLKRNGNE